jgi:hypothetical protein
MFVNPWYPALMLAFESNNVIDVRLRKIAKGGAESAAETRLMFSEKVDAAFEASSILLAGGQPSQVVDHYRKQVAANAARLTTS